MSVAVAMWDHSVFSRRWGREAEFADWDRALDGLADRGYDCIRIDAWPHLIQADPEYFTLRPQRPRWMWGNHAPVPLCPKRELRELMEKAAARGMRVALSSWFQADMDDHQKRVRTPSDFVRAWTRTLAHVEDLHSHILWVDLCNEFPLALWAAGAWHQIMKTPWPNIAPLLRPFDERQRAAFADYFRAIDALRERWPSLRYTFSFQGLVGGPALRHLDLSGFDLVEPHVWLSNDLGFLLSSGQALAVAELPGAGAVHRFLGPRVWQRSRARWKNALEVRLAAWERCAERNGNLPLVNSEGWASTMYADAPHGTGTEWRWVKEACATGVALAAERGWAGICTSNFCQPTFPGMWNDIGWHQEMTSTIRAAVPTRSLAADV